MKKTGKQMLAVLLILLLVCSVMPTAVAYTVSSGTVGSLTWALDSNGTLTVSGNGAMPDYDSTNDINLPWAPYIAQTKKLVIEDGITAIGFFAFKDFIALKEVSIADTVEKIDDGAFWNCTALTTLSLSKKLKEIGMDAFRNCDGLTQLVLPTGLEVLDWHSFAECDGLTSVTIPGSVTELEWQVFENCTALRTVTIQQGSNCSVHLCSEVVIT